MDNCLIQEAVLSEDNESWWHSIADWLKLELDFMWKKGDFYDNYIVKSGYHSLKPGW